jgi:exopolysaccharide biosynthesis polyprenyl glycosylphosphotransferase
MGVTQGRVVNYEGERLAPDGASAVVYPFEGATRARSVLHDATVEPSRRDSRARRMLAGADVAALIVTYLLLVAVFPDATAPHAWLLAALPAWVVLNKLLRLYDRDTNLIHKSTLNELPTIVQSVSFGSALAFLFAPAVSGLPAERAEIIVFWALACVLTPAFRYSARAYARSMTAPERVLIVGSGHVAELVATKLNQHPEYGVVTVGYVDVPFEGAAPSEAIEHLGGVADFERVCRDHDVERVVITFSSLAHENLLDMVRLSKRLRLKISVVPRLFEVIGHQVEIDQIEGMTLLGLRGITRSHSTLLIKRAVDIVGAALLILLAAPAMIAAAIAVKLTSPGRLIFVQQRSGRGNRLFPMFKFRTMVEGAEEMKHELAELNEMDGKMFKIADDPRVTRVGRILRRTSIDELPQLFNVLRGEMSLVGPRPLIPDETDQIIGWHRARLDLTPGLTGPWQVMGRNAIPFDEMVKLDYLYVADWSLWNDIKLLLRTLPVVVGRRGS